MLMLLYLVIILVLSDLVDKKWVSLSNLRASFGLGFFNIIFVAISDVVPFKEIQNCVFRITNSQIRITRWDLNWLVWMLIGKYSPKFYLLVLCRNTFISTEAGRTHFGLKGLIAYVNEFILLSLFALL